MPSQDRIAEEAQRIQALRERAAEGRRVQQRKLEALVQQITEVRGDLETNFTKLGQLTDQLRQHVRRDQTEATAHYLVYANAHHRLAGAIGAGLRRTASMDRLLGRAKEQQREEREREAEQERRRETRDHQRMVDRLTLPTADDFEEVYGEVLDHAE